MQQLTLFLTFLKIGLFTFGGGYAMIPLIQKEIVEKKKLITPEEFLDVIAIAQCAPGAVAVNLSVIIGYRILGISGALLCTLGVILPSFLIILLISMFLFRYRNHYIINKIFLGIRPAVVALIFYAVYKLIKDSQMNKKMLIISFITLILVAYLGINPIIIILIAVTLGAFTYKINNYKG